MKLFKKKPPHREMFVLESNRNTQDEQEQLLQQLKEQRRKLIQEKEQVAKLRIMRKGWREEKNLQQKA